MASLTQDPDQPIPSVVRPQPHPVPTLEASFHVALWALHDSPLCLFFFCFSHTAACFTCDSPAFYFLPFPPHSPRCSSVADVLVAANLFSVFSPVEELLVFIFSTVHGFLEKPLTVCRHCNILLFTSPLWRSVIPVELYSSCSNSYKDVTQGPHCKKPTFKNKKENHKN